MSLKTLLLPIISRRLFSRERLLHKRAKAEQKRVKAQAPHQLHYFHQVDDPYSALVAGVLPLPVLFMIAFSIAMIINYPCLQQQKERVAAHAGIIGQIAARFTDAADLTPVPVAASGAGRSAGPGPG